MTEEDLKEDDDDSEPELPEASENQEVENTDQSDEKLQHTGTARSITAAKILKADLAC